MSDFPPVGSSSLAKLLGITDRQVRRLARQKVLPRKVVDIDAVASLVDAVMTTVGAQLDGLAGRVCVEMAAADDPALCRARLFDESRRIRNNAAISTAWQ